MSIYLNEICGREFDWFAIDKEGEIAIFSTVGEGGVPEVIIENYKIHDEISEMIELPNWGSSKVWDDFSDLGLVVFDWDLPGGPYLKVRESNSTKTNKLIEQIKAKNTVPKFNISFKEYEKINDLSLFFESIIEIQDE